MTTEIRMYRIKPGEMDEWLAGWGQGVYPLRLKHGYTIPGAWVIRETNTFVWILSYDGPEDWAAKNAAYYASPEREKLDPDPAQHIDKADHWIVQPALPEDPVGSPDIRVGGVRPDNAGPGPGR